MVAQLRALGPPSGPPLLAVLPEASWRTVVAIVDALKGAGQHEITFIFRGTTAVAPPPPGELVNLDLVLAECEPALEFLPTLRDLRFRQKMETRERVLPEKLIECGCRADFDALRRLTWAGMGRLDGDPSVEVRVDMSSDGISDQLLSAIPTTYWRDVYPRLLSETKAPWTFEVDD